MGWLQDKINTSAELDRVRSENVELKDANAVLQDRIDDEITRNRDREDHLLQTALEAARIHVIPAPTHAVSYSRPGAQAEDERDDFYTPENVLPEGVTPSEFETRLREIYEQAVASGHNYDINVLRQTLLADPGKYFQI